MIDVFFEQVVPFRRAVLLLPESSEGGPIAVSTLYRWRERGIGGIKLESVKIGRTLYTSREALARFIQRVNELDEPELVGPPVPSTLAPRGEVAM